MVNWINVKHKIILGTPRSGTTFVSNWYANENKDYQRLSKEIGFEHFEPDHQGWPQLGDKDGIDKETKFRIQKHLTQPSIFKLHPGPDMSNYIFEYIKNKPVIVVERKDVLGQFLSYGIGWTTNKWHHYVDKTTPLNGLNKNQTFYYEKKWFDDLSLRLALFNNVIQDLIIERKVWFEELPNWTNSNSVMLRQNPQSNDEKLELLTNKDEFLNWYNNFEKSYKQ
tara:strand:+ start:2611 stop:3282 length:672 start_codon:yes stop_codon:yes gene_type:complete